MSLGIKLLIDLLGFAAERLVQCILPTPGIIVGAPASPVRNMPRSAQGGHGSWSHQLLHLIRHVLYLVQTWGTYLVLTLTVAYLGTTALDACRDIDKELEEAVLGLTGGGCEGRLTIAQIAQCNTYRSVLSGSYTMRVASRVLDNIVGSVSDIFSGFGKSYLFFIATLLVIIVVVIVTLVWCFQLSAYVMRTGDNYFRHDQVNAFHSQQARLLAQLEASGQHRLMAIGAYAPSRQRRRLSLQEEDQPRSTPKVMEVGDESM